MYSYKYDEEADYYNIFDTGLEFICAVKTEFEALGLLTHLNRTFY